MSTEPDQPRLCVRHKGDHLDVEVDESTLDPATRRSIESNQREFDKWYCFYLRDHAPVEVIDDTGLRVGVHGFPEPSRPDIVFVPDAGCALPRRQLPVRLRICPSQD